MVWQVGTNPPSGTLTFATSETRRRLRLATGGACFMGFSRTQPADDLRDHGDAQIDGDKLTQRRAGQSWAPRRRTSPTRDVHGH